MRLRPAACEVVDGVHVGLIVDIDNTGPVPVGLAIPRVVVLPESYGVNWGFEEAVADPPPDPNLVCIGETACGSRPEAHLVLEPNEHVARGWILERSPEPDMKLEIVAGRTEVTLQIPSQSLRKFTCFRLRAVVDGVTCSIVEVRESRCHTPGAIHLDVAESIGVNP